MISAKLKREYYLWKEGSGDYSRGKLCPCFRSSRNNHNLDQKPTDDRRDDCKEKDEQKKDEDKYKQKKLALLVVNCEEILFTEATEFVNLFSSSRPSYNQVTRTPESINTK